MPVNHSYQGVHITNRGSRFVQELVSFYYKAHEKSRYDEHQKTRRIDGLEILMSKWFKHPLNDSDFFLEVRKLEKIVSKSLINL